MQPSKFDYEIEQAAAIERLRLAITPLIPKKEVTVNLDDLQALLFAYDQKGCINCEG